MSRVAEWSPYTTYIVGDVVNYIGIRYTATAVNVNTPPLPATPIWVGVPPSTGVNVVASSTNATMYPTFVSATSGTLPVLVDSDFTYNPALGDISINDTVKIQSQTSGSRIAIGYLAGETSQNQSAVAVGDRAGQTNQGLNAVAVGVLAGDGAQGDYAVAVGNLAGGTNQGTNAVAVGVGAGLTGQGTGSIAIGQQAGQTNQHANSIILNASGSALDSDGTSRFFVKPVRNASSTDVLFYNSTSGEVSYNPVPSSSPTVETVVGTDPISPTINTTLLGGTNHSLASGSTIGFEKTIVKNTDNVFSPILTPTTFDGTPTNPYDGFLQVNVLRYDSINNRMYIGGQFFLVQGANYFYSFCYYDFATGLFNNVDTGIFGGVVNDIALDIANDRVYICGQLTQAGSGAGSISCNNVCIYVPSTNTYLPMGNDPTFPGANSTCNKMLYYNGYVYCIGSFTNMDSVGNTFGIARWNTTTLVWEALGRGFYTGSAGGGTGFAITRDGNDIWVGGTFNSVRDGVGVVVPNTNRLAKWNTTTSTWSGYGNAFNIGSITSLATLAPNEIFVGGSFTYLTSPTLYLSYSVKLNTSTLTFSQYGYTNTATQNTFIDTDGTLWLFATNGSLTPPPILSKVSTDAITSLGVYPPFFYDTTANKWTGLLGQGASNQLTCMERTGVAGEYWVGAGNQQLAIDAGNLTTFGGLLKFDKTKLEKITCPNLILNGQTARTRFHLIWKGQNVKLMNLDNTSWVVMNTSSVNANAGGTISAIGGQGQVFFY